MRRITVLITLLAAVGSAQAQRLAEPSTGLSVHPPAGYSATIAPPRPPSIAAIAIRRPNGSDTGCQVAYHPTPQNERLDELNVTAAGERWRGEAVRTLGALYEIEHAEPFPHAGIQCLLLGRILRMRDGTQARAKDVRTLFVIPETRRGRTSAVCVGDRGDFGARRDDFLSIIRSTTPPSHGGAANRPRRIGFGAEPQAVRP